MLLSKIQLIVLIKESLATGRYIAAKFREFSDEDIEFVKSIILSYDNKEIVRIQQLLMNGNQEEFERAWQEVEISIKMIHTIIDKVVGSDKEMCFRYEELVKRADKEVEFLNFWNLAGAKYYYYRDHETAFDIMCSYDMSNPYDFPEQEFPEA